MDELGRVTRTQRGRAAVKEAMVLIGRSNRLSGRAARRTHNNATVDQVVFESFTRHVAEVVGCTTYSFSVTAGCPTGALARKDVEWPTSSRSGSWPR